MPEFVRTAGTRFALSGQPFRVAGANNYYLAHGPDAMVEPVFAFAAAMGLNTLRTWGFLDGKPAGDAWFQSWDDASGQVVWNDGPNGLELLDRTIALAEQHGIRLILPLVNHWDDFGGMRQYRAWFGVDAPDGFYTAPVVREAYRRWVEHVLLRRNTRTGRLYRDEPFVLAWELANEPRAESGEALLEWAAEMSAHVKALDGNHLVGLGDEGFFRRAGAGANLLYNGGYGVDCECLLGIPGLDFGTFHLYPNYATTDDPIAFGSRWIAEHVAAGERAGKPMLLEEFGTPAASGAALRGAAYQAWLEAVVDQGGAGALLWMIAAEGWDGKPYPDYDGYTTYAASDVPDLVAFARARLDA